MEAGWSKEIAFCNVKFLCRVEQIDSSTVIYLEDPSTTTIGDTPISYLTITITRADKVIFIRVEV